MNSKGVVHTSILLVGIIAALGAHKPAVSTDQQRPRLVAQVGHRSTSARCPSPIKGSSSRPAEKTAGLFCGTERPDVSSAN